MPCEMDSTSYHVSLEIWDAFNTIVKNVCFKTIIILLMPLIFNFYRRFLIFCQFCYTPMIFTILVLKFYTNLSSAQIFWSWSAKPQKFIENVLTQVIFKLKIGFYTSWKKTTLFFLYLGVYFMNIFVSGFNIYIYMSQG